MDCAPSVSVALADSSTAEVGISPSEFPVKQVGRTAEHELRKFRKVT